MNVRIRNIINLIVAISIVTIALVVSLLLLLPTSNSSNNSAPKVITTSQVIISENALPGTSSWQIPVGQEASTQIQAYANATSVQAGQPLTFYVSTQKEGAYYSLTIYRLGWYQGRGGRLMTLVTNQPGHRQGYYNASTNQLVDCRSCRVDATTGLVVAHWQPSYTLIIPAAWLTGVYLAKFIDSDGMQTYVPFDVLAGSARSHSLYVAVTSDTTAAAYNDWGGYSLYVAHNNSGSSKLVRGAKVSFDRPYNQGYGSGYVLIFEADAIHWLEREGYDISYMSSVDLHEDAAQLLQHRVYLSLGHDEYWTKEMRDGVEYARNHGVSLAFLGANASYWQMRFEPDSTGAPNRTIVCYKVETALHDLSRDPLYGKDNARVTTKWRDPVLGRPENALIGIMYNGFGTSTAPWGPTNTPSPLLAGTGLQAGKFYGCGLIGSEWDHVFANGATPKGLHILGVSYPIDNLGELDVSDTTYYIASSGAMVFATGSLFWTAALDDYRFYTNSWCSDEPHVVAGMQKLMEHVMEALATR